MYVINYEFYKIVEVDLSIEIFYKQFVKFFSNSHVSQFRAKVHQV